MGKNKMCCFSPQVMDDTWKAIRSRSRRHRNGGLRFDDAWDNVFGNNFPDGRDGLPYDGDKVGCESRGFVGEFRRKKTVDDVGRDGDTKDATNILEKNRKIECRVVR